MNEIKLILVNERIKAEKDINILIDKLKDNDADVQSYHRRIKNLELDKNNITQQIIKKQNLILQIDEVLTDALK